MIQQYPPSILSVVLYSVEWLSESHDTHIGTRVAIHKLNNFGNWLRALFIKRGIGATLSTAAIFIAYFGVSRENAMKTLVPIALLVFLIGSLTQAASVPENLLQSANEVQGKDEVEHVSNKGFEDDLSEDDATDDDVEDEEDEGDQEDEVAEDEEDFDSDEDPER